MIQTWRLDTGQQTLALACEGGMPFVSYWGPPLPLDEDLDLLAAATHSDITGGMMDALPPVDLCPVEGDSLHAQPGLVAYANGAALHPVFSLSAVEEADDKLTFRLTDDAHGLILTLTFKPLGALITAQTSLTSSEPIQLHHLSAPVLPGPHSGDILHFSGRWIGEFHPHRSPWQPGSLKREARSGRSGHEHPPLAYFPQENCTNTQGTAYAMHYGWPGGQVMYAEERPSGARAIHWGHTEGSRGQGTDFATAPLYLAVSATGLNGCATAFQRALHDNVVPWPDATRPRPVHYNCWEAVYFDHDSAVLRDIATRAAALGAERFVLDDGWFGRRDDDTSSLGDWQVDPRKWPDGFGPFIDHIHALGMEFGLWVEPEMVNLDSDLARAHPEWILGRADQTEGRQQRVLNLALPEVRAHLFERLFALLDEHAIGYLKWDHNRLLPLPDATQSEGILELLQDLRTAFPQVEIESCASGGGRIDAGILHQTHRVWLSDSNDALERLRIQHDAALLLPASVTGSHVGPRTCHTSGRIHDIRFRAWVAAQRHMGFEMDPRELTEDEADVLKEVTTWWKANRDWRMKADILRLDSADPAVIAELQLARDGSRFVVFAGQAATSAQILPRPLRLAGLDPDARYSITLRNRAEAHHLSRGAPLLKDTSLTASGTWLMAQGLTLPWSLPDRIWVLEGERL